MTEPEQTELLATLREQTQELLQQIPGPLRKVSVSAGDSAVTVEWAEPDGPPAPAIPDQAGVSEQAPEQSTVDDRIEVTAPLVGTFYRAPEPGAPPFVEVGSVVEPDQTVAIVEAMKLMNPVKAEAPGEVVAIHVDNGQMIEFGQPLLTLTPHPQR